MEKLKRTDYLRNTILTNIQSVCHIHKEIWSEEFPEGLPRKFSYGEIKKETKLILIFSISKKPHWPGQSFGP